VRSSARSISSSSGGGGATTRGGAAPAAGGGAATTAAGVPGVSRLFDRRVGRKDRRRKANALGAFTDTVAHPRAAHGDRTNAGHDLALRRMSMAHQPLAAIIARLIGIPAAQGCDFGFDSLRQQRSRTVAPHLGQRIDKTAWLGKV